MIYLEFRVWNFGLTILPTLFCRVFYKIPGCFKQPDEKIPCGLYMGPQKIVDDHGNIFRGWIQGPEFFRINVQVLVIKTLEHFFIHEVGKFFKVHDKSRHRVDLARYPDLEFIIMPVVMRKAALAKGGQVAVVGPVLAVEAMCSIKMFPADDSAFFIHAHITIYKGKG